MQGDEDRPTDRHGARRTRAARDGDKRRLDPAAYPWQFRVKDRFERDWPLGFGVTTNTRGELVGVGVSPDYWEFDLETCRQIAFAWQGLCQRLEDEQRQRREQEQSGA